MRLRFTVSDPARGVPGKTVAVSAAPGTAMGSVRAALLAQVDAPASAPLYLDGSRVDDGSVLGDPPFLDGAVLTVSRPGGPGGRAARTCGAFLELHATGGPDAGNVHALAPGAHVIGRSPAQGITVADPDVSRVHARLDVTTAGVTVRDEGSTNGTLVDGIPVAHEAVELPPGAVLRVGSSSLVLRLPSASGAALTATGDGTLAVNRSPRTVPAPQRVEVRVPAEPPAPARAPFPVVAMALPLLVSIPMAVLWSPFALLFGLTTPAMLVANLLSDRRSGRRRHVEEIARYRAEEAACRARIDGALAHERHAREATYPDAATILTTVSAPSSRLWERRTGDPDHLELRLGSGTVASGVVEVLASHSGLGERTERLLEDVPVTVGLRDAGVVGVAGPRGPRVALVRHLLAQVAALHSPHDVHIAVLALDAVHAQSWQWVQWLPHSLPWDRTGAMLATNRNSAARLVAALLTVVDAREAVEPGARTPTTAPAVVVVLDGARELREVPGVPRLLTHGPSRGVYALSVAATTVDLPLECTVTVEHEGEVGSALRIRPCSAEVVSATADLVSASWAERFARAMAPLRDATPVHETGGIPECSRLVELFERVTGTDPLDVSSVMDSWRRSSRSTRALLGEHAAGVFAPDLRRDGPHVLVGGTTGSGKSELLQSLIASLALVNRPDELVFLLVDYKGGAAFAQCAHLPHAVGLVTDLDEHLTRRTLTSLSAEVRRREHLLRDAGAMDLEAYQGLVEAGTATPLPRLVVVVDEFRVLAEELPEFVSGLVRLAAVGRSLGLHVVLATQRPAGVVSPEIRANVNLRIALRVRDGTDSTDVVESPRAAAIPPGLPGRAVVRAGSGDLLEFQVARVGGRGASGQPPTVSVLPLDPEDGCADGSDMPREQETGPTDLARLVRTLADAAARLGARSAAPWLPPLPEVVSVTDVEAVLEDGVASPTALVVGLIDEPELMRRRAFLVDPASDGSLAVVGGPRSGRTGVLLACAAAASQASPADVHLYVAGVPGAAPGGLEALPHVGAVVGRGDTDRTVRLLRRVAAEVSARRDRGGIHRRPAVLLLVDGWEAMHRELEDADGGEPIEYLLRIVREGPSVGVTSVVTGDRTLLSGRIGAAFASRLLLRTTDQTDLLIAGVPPKSVPRHMPPGRGVLLSGDGIGEVQICRPAPLDPAPADAPRPPVPEHALPFRVPAMPERLSAPDLLVAGTGTGTDLLLGVGGDDIRPLGLALSDCRSLVIAGPAGSGRTSALALVAAGLVRAGAGAILLCPRTSPAQRLVPDAVEVLSGQQTERLGALLATARQERPVVVLVDDAEVVDGTRAEDLLLAHLADDGAGGVVLAGNASDLGARFRGLAAEVRRSRTGVLLSPTGYADGDILGVTVRRARSVVPGRGYLVRGGSVETVQLALPEPPAAARGVEPAAAAPPHRPLRLARHADHHDEHVAHPARRTR